MDDQGWQYSGLPEKNETVWVYAPKWGIVMAFHRYDYKFEPPGDDCTFIADVIAWKRIERPEEPDYSKMGDALC